MLSRKVTYSIILLNELDALKPNKNQQQTLCLLAVLEIFGNDKALINEIVPQLEQRGYIEMIDKGNIFILKADLETLTVYDLLQVFHDGIPVGEEKEQDYHGLDFYSNPRYPALLDMELDLKAESTAFFKRFTIASLAGRWTTSRPYDETE